MLCYVGEFNEDILQIYFFFQMWTTLFNKTRQFDH